MDTANSSLETGGPGGASHRYEFGPFVLDTQRRLLSRDGEPVAITPKTYDAILILIESQGRFLSKSELIKALWPDNFVEESSLTQQISTIRKTLGESPGENRYIVTVPGRGYRFAAQVTERPLSKETAPDQLFATASAHTDERSSTAQTPSPGTEIDRGIEDVPVPDLPIHLEPASKWRPRLRFILPVLVGLALIALVYALQRKEAGRTDVSIRPRSIAILPFRNLKKDADSDFLGISLADAVVAKLSYVSALRVRPSSAVEQYRNQGWDVQRVAAALNVDTLLTGNFIREGGDLRISAELIDVTTQRILWKKTFDMKYERLLTVQESVAQQIVDGLAVRLSPSEAAQLKADRPLDPLAYEFYLRGVDLYLQGAFPLAVKMLEKSTDINPNHALTWAHLGKAYTADASFQFGGREQYRKAQAAYERALALQPAQIEARVYMANMFTDTGRVEQAIPLLRQALETNPNHPEVHWELGYAYRFAGALKESVTECERARQLDPGVKLNSSALNSYLYLGQYDKFLHALPKGDDFALVVFYRGFAEYYSQDWEKAAADFDRAFELDHSLLQAQVGKALSFGIRHHYEKGLEILRAAEGKINERGVGDPEAIYKVAQAFGALGNRASALRVLKSSIANGFFPYPYLATDPLLNCLRNEKEFNELISAARRRHESFKSRFL